MTDQKRSHNHLKREYFLISSLAIFGNSWRMGKAPEHGRKAKCIPIFRKGNHATIHLRSVLVKSSNYQIAHVSDHGDRRAITKRKQHGFAANKSRLFFVLPSQEASLMEMLNFNCSYHPLKATVGIQHLSFEMTCLNHQSVELELPAASWFFLHVSRLHFPEFLSAMLVENSAPYFPIPQNCEFGCLNFPSSFNIIYPYI